MKAALRVGGPAAVLLLIVLVVGMSVTGALVRTVWGWQQEATASEVDQRTQITRWAVSTQAQRYVSTAEQVAAAVGARPDVTVRELDRIIAPLFGQGLAGASGVTLVVAATDAQVAQVQQDWRERGATGLTLDPAANAEDPGGHAFGVAHIALDGHPGVLGLDALQDLTLGTALRQARDTRSTTISDAYVLLKDRALPEPRQQLSLSIVAPVPNPDQAGPDQWVLLGMRVQDLVDQVVPSAAQGQVNVTLTGSGAEGRSTRLASIHTGESWPEGPVSEALLTVGQQRWTMQAQGTRATGESRYSPLATSVAVSGSVITVLLMLLVYRQFRARHKAESDSQRDALMLSAVLDSIADGVGVVDRQGRFLLHNRAARDLLGVSGDSNDPQQWQKHYGIYRPDGVTPFPTEELPLVRALAGERTDLVDMLIRNSGHPEGVLISVSGRPLTGASGVEGGGAVAVFHDVTERRRLEAEVRAEHDRYERLLGLLSDLGEGVLVTNGYGIVYANPAYARLVGYEVEELMALPSSALAADEEALAVFADLRERVTSEGSVSTAVTRLRHKDGHVVPVETAGLQVSDEAAGSGASQRVYVVRDLTERRRWEIDLAERAEQLQEANRRLQEAQQAAEAASRAKSEFLQSMSHEIRTPLNGVLGFTALLAQSPDAPEAAQWARWADTSGRVLLDLVNNGLDLAKIEAGQVDLEQVEFDLAELAGEALLPSRLKAREAGLRLDLEVAADLSARRLGDPTRVRQVMTNLVANATKFTPSGSVTLALDQVGPDVRLRVTDTGIGMTAEQQERLFQPFQQASSDTTRRFGGTGLGLFITRGLVDSMQGSISVTSRPGVGSTFTVLLPLPAAAGPPAAVRQIPRQLEPSPIPTLAAGEPGPGRPQVVSPSPPPRNNLGLRVLVAEDNPTNQLVARAMLQARGLSVDIVEDGEQAVAAAAGGGYDAVFMDCQMPGVDGFEATRRIRAAETGGRIPIVAMTANAFDDDRRACLDAGMDDFLPKPWKAAQLTEVLERLTRQTTSQAN
ncbi:hypothetical protein Kisp01_28810 [Kineosporia sp. NBRC 101677]|uniref:ATP-binding protein n=1 Tax=Kineosporia sp. NBRC 101677 TaxID=3032197 RepID=UPI0024A3C8A4|nr:ATP-binding protein [Kineosporia sp. NBRC 101677]GLY15866.1 hypothetical protein Kisp01_28810 [Kineosporia sp. NBRC 101677]